MFMIESFKEEMKKEIKEIISMPIEEVRKELEAE